MFPIGDYFQNLESQKKVARFLLETGLRVEEGNIYCNGVKMSFSRIAKKLDMDRRTVKATIDTIESNEELELIFNNLKSTAFFDELAQNISAGLIVIVPTDPHKVGILAGVSSIIANIDISIRQCITEDPEFTEEPKLYIITESSVPMEAMEKIKKIQGVKSVTIY